MKRAIRIAITMLLLASLMIGLSGCGQKPQEAEQAGTGAVAGDYYLDLTELGMKLTVYLRLSDAGEFTFANTLSFETVKSAGTYQAADEGWLMVFTSVNGEEKSISEGLTSGFAAQEDGTLDFSGFGAVPYGSANISTVSDEDPAIKLIAHPVTDDFIAPSTESEFRQGIYAAESVSEAGVEYHHVVSFYEDNTYLHVTRYEADEKMCFAYETGSYGVSTSQLALTPENGDRVQCEVADGSNLKLSVLAEPGAAERTALDFAKRESAGLLASLSGTGSIPGSVVTFDVTFELYEDGSYVAVADGYEETGLIAIDSAAEYAKQYPDHPATGVRGMSQVATVPYGACGCGESGGLTLTDLRVCTSENLTRFKATVAE